MTDQSNLARGNLGAGSEVGERGFGVGREICGGCVAKLPVDLPNPRSPAKRQFTGVNE
jgi:hypothetical protein